MDIGIIGGGASGMILASMLDKHHVTILERNNKLGKKLLLTGNGKCNFTNMSFDNLEYIYNCDFARNLYKRYDNKSFINYLETLGIVSKIETHKNIDYVYPNNNKSTSVYYSLLDKINENNVNIVYNAKVISAKYINNKFEINTEDNKKHLFDRIVFASGGASYKKTGSDGSCFPILKNLGHKVNPISPGLTPLRYSIENININKINFTGFRVDAKVNLCDKDNLTSEYGEIQFTKEYISGIPILNLSSKMARVIDDTKNDLEIVLDFSKNPADIKNILEERKKSIYYKRVEDFLCGYLPDELNIIICELLKLKNKKVKDLTSDELNNISKIITNFKVKCQRPVNFENAQITVGGIDVNEFDSDSLESKIVKGLYVIGEALDIDGICGGYNLQMCYSTASKVSDGLLNMEE